MEENKTEPTPGFTPEPIVLNYVWINGFRGLNNVGFNLGGEYRYEMKQDEAGNYELTQTENEKYVEEFFSNGENENNISLVSAIVGNNGAGKTSFLQALRYILVEDSHMSARYFLIYTVEGKKYYARNVSKSQFNGKIICEGVDNLSFKNKEKLSESKEIPKELFSVFYSSILDGSIHEMQPRLGRRIEDIDVSSNALYYNEQNVERDENLRKIHPWLEILSWEDTERQIQFSYFAKDFIEKHNEMIKIPKNMTVYLHDRFRTDYDLNSLLVKAKEDLKKKETEISKKIDLKTREEVDLRGEKPLSATCLLMEDTINSISKIEERFENEKNGSKLKERDFILQLIFHLITDTIKIVIQIMGNKKLLSAINDKIKLITFDKLNLEESVNEFLRSIIDVLKESDSLNTDKGKAELYSLVKSIADLYCFKVKKRNNGSCEILPEEYVEFSDKNRILNELLTKFVKSGKKKGDFSSDFSSDFSNINYPSFNLFSFDWNMSTGEKLMFNLFSRFHYAKKQMEENGVDDTSSVLILIDEGELGFHLEWQRKYIDALVQVLPLIFGKDRPLQIIFTTHSPVSLSDIPRDNVVFLNKKDVVKVVDDPIETFGANIHAIVRNGFFLEDGAMGEFAKKKITQLFEEIQNETFQPKGEGENAPDGTVKEASIKAIAASYKKRIAMVDEPILRQGLEQLLAERLSTIQKEDLALEYQKEVLAEKIKTYEKELADLNKKSEKKNGGDK